MLKVCMLLYEYCIRITACTLPSVPYIYVPCQCLVRSYPVASKIWNCTKVPGMRSLEFASSPDFPCRWRRWPKLKEYDLHRDTPHRESWWRLHMACDLIISDLKCWRSPARSVRLTKIRPCRIPAWRWLWRRVSKCQWSKFSWFIQDDPNDTEKC